MNTDQSAAPQVSAPLRPATIPLAPLRIAPRPAEPTQRLTARPLPHDLDPYKAPETAKPAPVAKLHAPTRRPGALIGRGLFDDELRPASWAAFGEGPSAA